MVKKIKVENDTDLRIFMISAFRYVLGRMTYVVPTIANIIYQNRDILDYHTIVLIIEEIEGAEKRNDLGMKCDIDCWLALKGQLKQYIQSR